MRLAQDDEVIDALAPDRADQPFGKAILPRRRRRDRLISYAHGPQSACENDAVDPIPIPDEISRGIIPRKCLGYLMRNPFCRCRESADLVLQKASASQCVGELSP